jgi:hypothetical protein
MQTINPLFEKQLSRLLGELPPRARSIVRRRYGVGGASGMTLEAIGEKEGITRERVRQIENDAIRKLKKSEIFPSLASYEKFISDVVEREGGMIAEEALLALPEFQPVKDKNTLALFLDLTDKMTKRKADDDFRARWHTSDAPAPKIENAILAFSKELKDRNETLSASRMQERFATHLSRAGISSATPAVLANYIDLSKRIEKNAWDEYGHVESPFVRPRGMRESAFVALARARNPLHFRDIAKKIEEFSDRPVHIQTVHNELIKDDRFVLVGRGLYALREWGYEPGFIKDVLVRLLRERGSMTRDQILAEVVKRRQVKPSTVFINLQNKKLFKPQDDGTYTLIS